MSKLSILQLESLWLEAEELAKASKAKMKAMFPAVDYPKHKDVIDWAASTFKNDNHAAWFMKQYKADPSVFEKHKNELEDVYSAIDKHTPEIHKLDLPTSTDMYSGIQHLKRHAGIALQEKMKGAVQNPDNPIVDLGDGFKWHNIGEDQSQEIGDAMGHCGNTATPCHTDNMLSFGKDVDLRSKIFDGDEFNLHDPSLTFIGSKIRPGYKYVFFGETKGRENKAPARHYHDAILALCEKCHANGITPVFVGGGYSPHENFQRHHLSPEDQARFDKVAIDLHSVEDPKKFKELSDAYNKRLRNSSEFHDWADSLSQEQLSDIAGNYGLSEDDFLDDEGNYNEDVFKDVLHNKIMAEKRVPTDLGVRLRENIDGNSLKEKVNDTTLVAPNLKVLDYYGHLIAPETIDKVLDKPGFGGTALFRSHLDLTPHLDKIIPRVSEIGKDIGVSSGVSAFDTFLDKNKLDFGQKAQVINSLIDSNDMPKLTRMIDLNILEKDHIDEISKIKVGLNSGLDRALADNTLTSTEKLQEIYNNTKDDFTKDVAKEKLLARGAIKPEMFEGSVDLKIPEGDELASSEKIVSQLDSLLKHLPESLQKAPFSQEQPSMERPHEPSWYEGMNKVHTYSAGTVPQAGNDWHGHAGKPLYHHVYEKEKIGDSYVPTLHVLSMNPDPFSGDIPLSSSAVGHKAIEHFDSWDQKHSQGHPWKEGSFAQIGETITRPSWQGIGLGKILYEGILNHHGRLTSDSSTSSAADKVWSHLIKKPGVTGQLGPQNERGVHWAETQNKAEPLKTYDLGGKSLKTFSENTQKMEKSDPVKVRFSLGTNKMREVRDLAEANGGKINSRVLRQQHGINLQDYKLAHLANGQGDISAEDIQAHIDNHPKNELHVSEGEFGTDLSHLPNDKQVEHATSSFVQRHSPRKSKLARFEVTPAMEQKLHEAGVWETFSKLNHFSQQSGHPSSEKSIGWVRYDEDPNGMHIDEIQTDFPKSFDRVIGQQLNALKSMKTWSPEQVKMAKLYHPHGHLVDRVRGMSDAEIDGLASQASSHFPPEHINKIHEILFDGQDPSTFLHEAFLQHKRNTGKVGKKVQIWTPESKGKIALQDQNAPVPVHMKVGYGDGPKKMGYKPSQYGNISVQDTPTLAGRPTQEMELRKKLRVLLPKLKKSTKPNI